MVASMRQSAQVMPLTVARLRRWRSGLARLSSRQAPATTVQSGPRPEESRRVKSSLKRSPLGGGGGGGAPASGTPASGGGAPASGTPASGGGAPASGTPASGGGAPASGTPASAPPPAALPVTMKSSNTTPATLVDIPAVPASTMADGEVSLTLSLATPFTDATSCTGPAPVAVKEMPATVQMSGTPLGASPSTVATPPRHLRICRCRFEVKSTS